VSGPSSRNPLASAESDGRIRVVDRHTEKS
jgi:hypothetical protein